MGREHNILPKICVGHLPVHYKELEPSGGNRLGNAEIAEICRQCSEKPRTMDNV